MLKKFFLIGTTGLYACLNPVLADNIGGSPVADFHKGEFEIPCVLVKNYDSKVDDTYYDVILSQRGSSMNWALKFAEVEEGQNACEEAAAFAETVDEDYEEVDEEYEEEVEAEYEEDTEDD